MPTIVPAGGDWVQVMKTQRSEKHCWYLHRSGIIPLWQSLVRRRFRAKSRMQLQLIIGGVVSTTVTVWLQVFVCPQSSTPCQVCVMTHGQLPLVTVPTTVIVTLPGPPAASGHWLV